MTTSRRNLIISPIGDQSVHRSWLSDATARSFDLLLIYYGDRDDFGRADATYYVKRKGFKWELVHEVLQTHASIVERYDNVWVPDNDIRADTPSINRLFELFRHYDLKLAQPAIAKGEVSYKSLRQSPGVILRYTPFVEIMCPLFAREALLRVAPSFRESRSGWGLDWVWPRFFQPHEIAIIDQVGVEHTGKLFTGENYQQLARRGIDPAADFERVTARYGGFKKRLHRRLVRGKARLPEIRQDGSSASLLTWLFNGTRGLRWRKTG